MIACVAGVVYAIQQTSCAVMPENQIVLCHNFRAGRIFRFVESITNQFKYQIIIGHVKYDHHHARLSRRDIKTIFMAYREMIQQFPVQFSFAMLVKTD